MNPQELREDIPALERTVYLNTGASGPSPRRVVSAANDALEYHDYVAPAAEGMYQAAFDLYEETRTAVADYLGAGPHEIALTGSTGDGIAKIAASIDWDPGDVVVRTDLEHPASEVPWERLERRYGVEVRVVETDAGHVDRDEFEAAVADARLVTFSSVCWTTGSRLAVSALTEMAHDAGARVLVDGVQSVGQHPVDVEEWGADAVAASGHKWLLGQWGSGFLYVDREFAEQLSPGAAGYFSVEDAMAGPPFTLKPGAKRFEVGTASLAPYATLVEGIAINRAIGFDTIQSRIERLTDRLKAGLDDERLVSPRSYESGLVSFRVEDAEATVERLRDGGIRIKTVPAPDAVRASIHVFNTAEDVDRLLDAL